MTFFLSRLPLLVINSLPSSNVVFCPLPPTILPPTSFHNLADDSMWLHLKIWCCPAKLMSDAHTWSTPFCSSPSFLTFHLHTKAFRCYAVWIPHSLHNTPAVWDEQERRLEMKDWVAKKEAERMRCNSHTCLLLLSGYPTFWRKLTRSEAWRKKEQKNNSGTSLGTR